MSHKYSIDTIISDYNNDLRSRNPSDNIELEAKIQSLTKETFLESLQEIMKVSELANIETSINNVTNKVDNNGSSYSYIESHFYDNNKKVSEAFSTKKNIGIRFNSSGEFMKYTIAVSKESTVPKESSGANLNTLTRFKLRLSFITGNNWRYDYTLTISKQASEIVAGTIGTIRSQFFGSVNSKMTPKEIIPVIFARTNDIPGVKFEIEVERLSQEPITSKQEIDSALSVLWRTFDTSFRSDDKRIIYIREIYDSISKNAVQKKLTLKNILNAAKSLTKSEYYRDIYEPIGYFVTDKADGERCLIYGSGAEVHIIYSGLESAPIAGGIRKIIVDCEKITTFDNKKMIGVFDVLFCDEVNLTDLCLEERMAYANNALNQLKDTVAGLGYELFVKDYVQISSPIEEAFLKVNNKKKNYKTDGLIISSQSGSYYETKNYKWKPTEENTIDFMVIRCPKTMLGSREIPVRDSYDAYILLSGANKYKQHSIKLWPDYSKDTGIDPYNNPYIPVPFKSSLWPYTYVYYHKSGDNTDLHGKICEFSVSESAAKTLMSAFSTGHLGPNIDLWNLSRIREDRQASLGEYGNDYDIAESVFSNVIDPFLLEDLWSGNSSYFEKTRDLMYVGPNKFKRFIIKQAFEKYLNESSNVLDLAAGRGADMATYMIRGINRLVAIDIDPTALVELIRRSVDKKIVSLRKSSLKPLKLNVLVTDCSGRPTVNKEAIDNRFGITEVNTIVCNFAFHYFCGNATSANNALSFIGSMCSSKEETIVIMTIMDGSKVFDLLKDYPTGKAWSVSENGIEKYLIRKDYTEDKLANYGQKISIKLPMTTKLYSEPLCNISAVVADAEKYNLRLVGSEPFNNYLSQWSAKDPKLMATMSADDINYCGLHTLLIFKSTPTETIKKTKRY